MKKLFILLSISLSILFSVEVTLKNGQVYNGEIIRQNSEELILKTVFGELKFPVDSIDRISFTEYKSNHHQKTNDNETQNLDSENNKVDKRTRIENEFKELGCSLSHSTPEIDYFECKISSNAKKIFTDPNEYLLFKSKNDSDKFTNENSSSYNELSLGITFSDIYGNDIDSELEIEMDDGYIIGLLHNDSGLLIGFSYNVRKYKMSANIDEIKLKGTNQLNFINLDFMFKVGNKGYKPALLIGGRGSFFLSGEGRAEVCYLGNCESDINDIDKGDLDNELDYGIIGGLYIPTSKKMSLKILGYLGLFKMWDEDSDIKNRSIEATLQFKL